MARSSLRREKPGIDDALRKRVRKLASTCLVAFAVIAVALAYWQVIRAGDLREDVRNPRFNERKAAEDSGDIAPAAPDNVDEPRACRRNTAPAVSSRITSGNAIGARGMRRNGYSPRPWLQRQCTQDMLASPDALSELRVSAVGGAYCSNMAAL